MYGIHTHLWSFMMSIEVVSLKMSALCSVKKLGDTSRIRDAIPVPVHVMQCLYGLTISLINFGKNKTNTNPNPDPNRYRRCCLTLMLGYRSLEKIASHILHTTRNLCYLFACYDVYCYVCSDSFLSRCKRFGFTDNTRV